MSIEKKIEMIRFKKRLGIFLYSVMSFTFFAIIIIQLTSMMQMQTDTLNKLNDIDVKTTPAIETTKEAINVPAIEQNVSSDAERDLIERVVMAEAGNQPYNGMMAVAQTVRDRAVLWGKTPTEVVTQQGQYTDHIPELLTMMSRKPSLPYLTKTRVRTQNPQRIFMIAQ